MFVSCVYDIDRSIARFLENRNRSQGNLSQGLSGTCERKREIHHEM